MSDFITEKTVPRDAGDTFPFGGGELGTLIRTFDWSTTSLGPISAWPAHLKSAVSLMLPAKAQIVLFWGPDYIALYNDAYAPTIGEKHPRALGRPARESWSELWDDLEPLLRSVRETGETVFAKDRPFSITRHGYLEDVFFDISYSAVRDEAGAVAGIFCIVSETTERVNAQRALSEAQERLSYALNASGMVGTFDWHVQTDIFYVDTRFAAMFSVDPEKGKKGASLAEYLAGIHPDDVERIRKAVDHAVATGEKYVQEYRVVAADGTIRWIEVRGQCLYDDTGKPTRFPGVAVDITVQKEAQEHEQLLVREMRHRIKNLVAVMDAIIALSARSAQTVQEMSSSLRGRLSALIRAKDLIRPGTISTERAQSEQTTMDVLVGTILQPYIEHGARERIVARGPAVMVGPNAVTSLALTLHESATNALKYGALSTPAGELRVTWRVQDDALHLQWTEKTGGTGADGAAERRLRHAAGGAQHPRPARRHAQIRLAGRRAHAPHRRPAGAHPDVNAHLAAARRGMRYRDGLAGRSSRAGTRFLPRATAATPCAPRRSGDR